MSLSRKGLLSEFLLYCTIQDGESGDPDLHCSNRNALQAPAGRKDNESKVGRKPESLHINIGESALAHSNSPRWHYQRAAMKWSWLRNFWYGNRDAYRRTIEKSRKITEKLDEEAYKLRATLDGEEFWFRRGDASDRKTD